MTIDYYVWLSMPLINSLWLCMTLNYSVGISFGSIASFLLWFNLFYSSYFTYFTLFWLLYDSYCSILLYFVWICLNIFLTLLDFVKLMQLCTNFVLVNKLSNKATKLHYLIFILNHKTLGMCYSQAQLTQATGQLELRMAGHQIYVKCFDTSLYNI